MENWMTITVIILVFVAAVVCFLVARIVGQRKQIDGFTEVLREEKLVWQER